MAAKQKRNAKATRKRILKAAESEYAQKGLYGARIDSIAEKADVNKRMIYQYFGNKEDLYVATLEVVYARLTAQELQIEWEDLSAKAAIKKIINLYFHFLDQNSSYVNLILWENLNQGKYINKIDFSSSKSSVFKIFTDIMEKGKQTGEFKSDMEAEQIILSILTFTFSYFSNRHTLSKLLSYDFSNNINIQKRIKVVTDMILEYICY